MWSLVRSQERKYRYGKQVSNLADYLLFVTLKTLAA